jgi:hypothetical protein
VSCLTQHYTWHTGVFINALLIFLDRPTSYEQSQADVLPDTFISKTTRLYRDSRTLTQGAGTSAAASAPAGPSAPLDRLNQDLSDVTKIMTKNMEDLLWRGDSLDREFMTISLQKREEKMRLLGGAYSTVVSCGVSMTNLKPRVYHWRSRWCGTVM